MSGIGHRSVYSQGEWSSDFRSAVVSATPIKVNIPGVKNLPYGLRIEMSVKLEDFWPWQSWWKERHEDPDSENRGKATFASAAAE